jgi:hypothetical protein
MSTKSVSGITSILVFCLFSLVSGCGLSDSAQAPTDKLVISEFMSSPANGGPEWIELHNHSNTAVNLKGCEVRNQDDQIVPIDGDLMVASQGYFIVANEKFVDQISPLLEISADFIFQSQMFQITSTGGLSLLCDGTLEDEIVYQLGPHSVAATARSWQRQHDKKSALVNDQGAHWCYTLLLEDYVYADRRFASPGRTNTICESAMPYAFYDDQASVLIDGIDWNATLKVAEAEFSRRLSTSELVIWAIRDQHITPEIAQRISTLYFENIDMLYDTEPFTVIDWNHAVWHFAWAISNLYRNGDSEVKKVLQAAYDDAIERPETLERFNYLAINHIRNDVVVMGDIHLPAHERMKQLIVVPGNADYPQSFEEYENSQRSLLLLRLIHFLYLVKSFFTGSSV